MGILTKLSRKRLRIKLERDRSRGTYQCESAVGKTDVSSLAVQRWNQRRLYARALPDDIITSEGLIRPDEQQKNTNNKKFAQLKGLPRIESYIHICLTRRSSVAIPDTGCQKRETDWNGPDEW